MFTLMNFIWSSFSVFMIYQAEAKRLRPFSAPSAIPRLHEPRKYPRYLGRPIQGCEPAARGGGQGLAFVAVTQLGPGHPGIKGDFSFKKASRINGPDCTKKRRGPSIV
jgi:hypothetical protein